MLVLLVGPEREENLSLRYLAASLHAAGPRQSWRAATGSTTCPGSSASLPATTPSASSKRAREFCGDYEDGGGLNEFAAPPLPDTDGDGLPDECEVEIFGTNPDAIDSDGDGLPDGAENHDGGTMNNAEEAAQFYDVCGDADDGVEEGAARPLREPNDPLTERWARAILGEPDDETTG